MFATSIHFHLSLIFAGKARSLQSELCPVRGSTNLASKYKARVELTNRANTLAFYDTATITAIKIFKVQAPGVIVIKTFTAVIYQNS